MFGSIKNQLRSVIEWKNPSPEIVFEKWSSDTNEIKNASKLIVGPGQGCIFVYQGQVKEVYTQQGIIELSTANIPFWTTITKFLQAFESEHKVGLYFFKLSQLVDLKWGTISPVKYEDPKYKFPVGLRAFGNFSMQIEKPEWFFQNIMGAKDILTTAELRELIASRILQNLTDYLANAKYTYTEIDSHRTDIATQLVQKINIDFDKLGFTLADFRVEGTSFDDDTMKRINRIADMSAEAQAASTAGLTYAQLQQLEALKDAAKNPGGTGMVMGMGLGLNMGQQIVGATNIVGSDDFSVRLKKLKDLLDQGLITQEDFEAKKKDILSKI